MRHITTIVHRGSVLDLTTQAIRTHWLAIAPGLGPLFDQIGRVEDWTVDNEPEVARMLASFGARLAVPGAAQALAQTDRGRLLFVLVYMSTPRAFRIIQWLDDEHDGLGSRMMESLLLANGAGVYAGVPHEVLADALVARLRVINNTPFFANVFGPERLTRIARAVYQYREEKDHA